MKKRFAMGLAAALVAVLLAGSAALSLGALGARPASGSGDPAPRVRTIERTVTIHKRAPQSPAFVNAISAPGASSLDDDDKAFDDDGSEYDDRDDEASEHDGGEDGGHDDVDIEDDDAFETDGD